MPDFSFLDEGTIAVLTPQTDAARAWVDEHIDPDHMQWAGGVVIEHRFVLDIITGLDSEGLTIDVGGAR